MYTDLWWAAQWRAGTACASWACRATFPSQLGGGRLAPDCSCCGPRQLGGGRAAPGCCNCCGPPTPRGARVLARRIPRCCRSAPFPSARIRHCHNPFKKHFKNIKNLQPYVPNIKIEPEAEIMAKELSISGYVRASAETEAGRGEYGCIYTYRCVSSDIMSQLY